MRNNMTATQTKHIADLERNQPLTCTACSVVAVIALLLLLAAGAAAEQCGSLPQQDLSGCRPPVVPAADGRGTDERVTNK